MMCIGYLCTSENIAGAMATAVRLAVKCFIMMKKTALFLALAAHVAALFAQGAVQPFKGTFRNAEYDVYLKIDLHGAGIVVPGHDIFGELPGYLGKSRYSFYWLITSAEVVDSGKAAVVLINDYGSEDLKATLVVTGDSSIVLTQGEGSTIKVPENGKWQKLPKRIELVREK